jgi:integrase
MAKHRTGYLFKRGGSYYVSWRINGRAFAKVLKDEDGNAITDRRKAEAEKVRFMAPFVASDEATALEAITAKIEGRKAEVAQFENERHPAPALAMAWAEYVKAPNRPDSGESTLRQYGFQFSQFAEWMREKHPEASTLRDVTKEIAEEYAGHLNHDRLSPGTYNKHLNLLTLVFRVLKDKAKLAGNPWADIQRKRMAPHTRRELTVDELRKACDAATGELRVLLALGVYTGLRLGDCATLRWGEVDLRRNIIRRVPNKTARSRPDKVVHVPIHPTLSNMLADLAGEAKSEYVVPETAALYSRRIDLVTDLVQRHFTACGISLHRPGTGTDGKRAVLEVGFHSLRHTFVSLCRESGAPLSVVESIVGHSNPQMTRLYSHTSELAAGQAVAALPAVIGETRPAQKRDAGALLREARSIVEAITKANWQGKRAELLELLAMSSLG